MTYDTLDDLLLPKLQSRQFGKSEIQTLAQLDVCNAPALIHLPFQRCTKIAIPHDTTNMFFRYTINFVVQPAHHYGHPDLVVRHWEARFDVKEKAEISAVSRRADVSARKSRLMRKDSSREN